jgi:hypothetical protein
MSYLSSTERRVSGWKSVNLQRSARLAEHGGILVRQLLEVLSHAPIVDREGTSARRDPHKGA